MEASETGCAGGNREPATGNGTMPREVDCCLLPVARCPSEAYRIQEEWDRKETLEDIIRAAYDDYTNGRIDSVFFTIRQAAMGAFQMGRIFERDYGMKTPEGKRRR